MRTEDAVLGHDAILSAVNLAAERFLHAADWRQAIDEVLARLGEATAVSRVVIFEAEPDAEGEVFITRRYEWRAGGIEARPDEALRHIPLRSTGGGRWVDVLGRGGIIAAHVKDLPGTERETMSAQGISSVLAVPIFVEEQWWGFFGFDACGAERPWSEADIEALRAAARILGEAIRRERTAAALAASEARYRTLAESAQDSIFIIDRDLRVQYVNQFGARALGSSPTGLVGKTVGDIFPPAITQQYERNLRLVLSTGEPVYAEGPSAYVGRELQLGTQLVPIRNEAGEVTSVLGTARDITDRWRAEQVQRESDERFRAITESASDAIVVANGDGKIVLWNRGAEQMFLYRAGEAIGRPVASLIAEPYRAPHQEAVDRMHAAGEPRRIGRPYEAIGLRKDGTTVPVEISLAFWTEAKGRFAGAIIRDITARREAEEALRQWKAELEEAQRIAQLGSWEWMVETDSIQWSEGLYRILGIDPSEPEPAFAGGLSLFYTPESWDQLAAAVDLSLRAAEPFELDLEQIRADGTAIWTTTRGEVTMDAAGRVVGLRGTVLDITERKRAEAALRASEERLRQAQKMEAVGQLAGGIAHDFNNLLTAITGYTEFALEQLEDGHLVKSDVAEIRNAAARAATLTRQLLAFGRKQVLQPRVVDLGAVLLGVDAMLRRMIGEDIVLTTVIAPDLEPVFADPSQIEQILMNLAGNARDAMPNGGGLEIEAVNVDVSDQFARSHPDAKAGRYAALTVRDTGCGMSAEIMAHVFEPFFTTKGVGKGTGLGLSTVYGIAKQTGGFVDVESVVGHGTAFRIYLPLANRPADEVVVTTAEITRLGGPETVLLVEDEASVRTLVSTILTRYGYDVLEARDADDALAMAGGHPGPIHLLVTDVVMPGMNGRVLARQIAARRPQTRMLFISGYDVDVILGEDARPDGIEQAFLEKPFTQTALLDAVRRALDADLPA